MRSMSRSTNTVKNLPGCVVSCWGQGLNEYLESSSKADGGQCSHDLPGFKDESKSYHQDLCLD
jgi:hypothetical protein